MPSTAFARKQRPALTQPLNKLYRFIPLTQGQIAIVDLEDFERLSQWVWFAMWNPHTRGFRAARTEERRHVYMHQEIMGFKGVDHRDRFAKKRSSFIAVLFLSYRVSPTPSLSNPFPN